MRIAIIDEGIDVTVLQHPARVVKQITWDGKLFIEKAGGKHAACCARLLEICGQDYELVDIQITDNWKEPVSVNRLTAALRLCDREAIDLVCLSVGTTHLSEDKQLGPVIRKLLSSGVIIVAALSNQGCMTLPAAYKGVICGVQDQEKQFLPGQCVIQIHPVFGEVVVVNTKLHEQSEFWIGNSFAPPVIAGWLLQNKNACFPKAGNLEKYKKAAGNNPVIAFISADALYEVCKLMDILKEQNHLEAVAIVENASSDDIRIVTRKNDEISRADLLKEVDKYVECSLLFSVYDFSDYVDNFFYDAKVSVYQKKVVIAAENGERIEIERKQEWMRMVCAKLLQILE